jgi:hypothetical protein
MEKDEMLDPSHDYFPEADDPVLDPFKTAFFSMMFAHARFEECVRDLQIAVAGRALRWPAKKRPKEMTKLIRKWLGEIPELGQIENCLCRAVQLCHDRNQLAHGIWWRFDSATSTVTVSTEREDEDHKDFGSAEITRIAEQFKDLEVELWKLKRLIEARKGN